MVSGYSPFLINVCRKLIDFEKLNPESAVYWSQLCEYMKTKGADGEVYLDDIMPTVVVFCDYMQEYFNR